MQLKDSLYTIRKANTASPQPHFDLQLHADHTIYRAHFPQQPVTPGVCLIQIATELLGQLLGQPLQVMKVKQAKYLAIVSPIETPQITYVINKVSPDETDGTIRTQVTVTDGRRDYTQLSMTLTANHL